MTEKNDLSEEIIFQFKPKKYTRDSLLFFMIFLLACLTFIIIFIFAIFNADYSNRGLFLVFLWFFAFWGSLSIIFIWRQINSSYFITKNSVIYCSSEDLIKTKKKIDLRNIAFVILWNDCIEIADKKGMKSSLKFLDDTQQRFIPPIIRRYKHVLFHLDIKDPIEQDLRKRIIEYLIDKSKLVQHKKFDFIYLS